MLAMRFSKARIKALQALLKDELGLMYTDEQAQEAGMAIVRILAVKAHRANLTKEREEINE